MAGGWKTQNAGKSEKKKQMHVQMIKHLPAEVLEQMQSMTLDAHVRKVLKSYNRSED